MGDAIQKRSGSVIKKDVTKDGKSLNESLGNVPHKTSGFNMIVAKKEAESMSILVGKVRDKWSDKKKSFLIYIK